MLPKWESEMSISIILNESRLIEYKLLPQAPESPPRMGEPSSPRGKPLALTLGAKTPKESMHDADCSSHFVVGTSIIQCIYGVGRIIVLVPSAYTASSPNY